MIRCVGLHSRGFSLKANVSAWQDRTLPISQNMHAPTMTGHSVSEGVMSEVGKLVEGAMRLVKFQRVVAPCTTPVITCATDQ